MTSEWLRGASAAVNVVARRVFASHVARALIPVAVFSLGWSLSVLAVTRMVLDLVPERRGMASSVQAFIGALTNAAVAGVLAPLVMHSAMALALASAGLLLVGAAGWWWVRGRWPQARQD